MTTTISAVSLPSPYTYSLLNSGKATGKVLAILDFVWCLLRV